MDPCVVHIRRSSKQCFRAFTKNLHLLLDLIEAREKFWLLVRCIFCNYDECSATNGRACCLDWIRLVTFNGVCYNHQETVSLPFRKTQMALKTLLVPAPS